MCLELWLVILRLAEPFPSKNNLLAVSLFSKLSLLFCSVLKYLSAISHFYVEHRPSLNCPAVCSELRKKRHLKAAKNIVFQTQHLSEIKIPFGLSDG